MSAIEKMVEWLDSKAKASVLIKDYWLEAATKARSLLSEEKATGTAKCVSGHDGGCPWYIPGSNPPSRHAAEEPLAVLADRKGFNRIQYDAYTDGQKSVYLTEGEKYDKDTTLEQEFYGGTYAAAEAKARQFLNTLPDKGGK